MESNATAGTAQPTGLADQQDPMESLAQQLRYSSTGQRAALRRVALTKSFEADAIVLAFITKAQVSEYDRRHGFDRWRMIAHVGAMLVGTGEPGPNRPFIHARNKSLGKILVALDYPENRLLRLLSVRGEALDDQVRRVARILAQKGERQINLWTLYGLLDGNEAKAKAARIKIAHDYYAAQS